MEGEVRQATTDLRAHNTPITPGRPRGGSSGGPARMFLLAGHDHLERALAIGERLAIAAVGQEDRPVGVAGIELGQREDHAVAVGGLDDEVEAQRHSTLQSAPGRGALRPVDEGDQGYPLAVDSTLLVFLGLDPSAWQPGELSLLCPTCAQAELSPDLQEGGRFAPGRLLRLGDGLRRRVLGRVRLRRAGAGCPGGEAEREEGGDREGTCRAAGCVGSSWGVPPSRVGCQEKLRRRRFKMENCRSRVRRRKLQ